MAQCGDAKLFFCLLFITLCSGTLEQRPLDCCLSVTNKIIDKKLVANYYVQDKGCSLAATILVTRRGRKLCVPAHESWVQEVKQHVDHLRKVCKENNYQGKRCSGLKDK